MIQRCIFCFFLIFVFGIVSCNNDDDLQVDFEEFELILDEAKKINDGLGFFQKPDKVQLAADSIIIAFSGYSGVSMYAISDGNQVDFINPRGNPKRSLFFSSFDAGDFPIVYLLEARQNKIFVYNFIEKEFVDEIPLNLDTGTSLRISGGKFKFFKGSFYVELNPEGTPLLDSNYYKNSGKFIGVFDAEGVLQQRIIDYPNQLTNPVGYIVPANYYSFDFSQDKMYICFPFEKYIRVYDLDSNFDNYQTLPIPRPENIELDLIYLPNKFYPGETPVQDRKISARVSDLIVQENRLFLSFVINDNQNNDRFREFTSLFQLDLNEMKWKVQSELIDSFDFGMFVGPSNGSFLYLDASVTIKDDKFINFVSTK